MSFKKNDRVMFVGTVLKDDDEGARGTIVKTDGPGAGQFYVGWDDGEVGWMFADELAKVEGESCK